jgi:hypothetical protein
VGTFHPPSLNFRPRLEQLEGRALLSIFAVGGTPGHVEVFAVNGGAKLADFEPYFMYSGNVNVAVADFNKDGVKDLVVAPADGNPQVKVYNGQRFVNGTFDDSAPDASLFAMGFVYGINFNVGVLVAAGDVNQDGYADLVTGPSAGNPHVKVFDGLSIADGSFTQNVQAQLLTSFFSFGLNFNVGAHVAVGDINHDGAGDVITGASAGNPHVKAYDGRGITAGDFTSPESHVILSFFPYALQFNIGATVAAGDTNGDTFVDLITGASTGNPDVRTYSGQKIAQGGFFNPAASQMTQFFAYGVQTDTGVWVASLNFDGVAAAEIMTGNTSGPGIAKFFAGDAIGSEPLPKLQLTFGNGLFQDGIAVAA